jgi:hypothetical protein
MFTEKTQQQNDKLTAEGKVNVLQEQIEVGTQIIHK